MRNLVVNHDIDAQGCACIHEALGEEPQHRVADFSEGRSNETSCTQPYTRGQHGNRCPGTKVFVHYSRPPTIKVAERDRGSGQRWECTCTASSPCRIP